MKTWLLVLILLRAGLGKLLKLRGRPLLWSDRVTWRSRPLILITLTYVLVLVVM